MVFKIITACVCVVAAGGGWVSLVLRTLTDVLLSLASSELSNTQIIEAFCSLKTDGHQDLYMWR